LAYEPGTDVVRAATSSGVIVPPTRVGVTSGAGPSAAAGPSGTGAVRPSTVGGAGSCAGGAPLPPGAPPACPDGGTSPSIPSTSADTSLAMAGSMPGTTAAADRAALSRRAGAEAPPPGDSTRCDIPLSVDAERRVAASARATAADSSSGGARPSLAVRASAASSAARAVDPADARAPARLEANRASATGAPLDDAGPSIEENVGKGHCMGLAESAASHVAQRSWHPP
jgi:hypothetical protein